MRQIKRDNRVVASAEDIQDSKDFVGTDTITWLSAHWYPTFAMLTAEDDWDDYQESLYVYSYEDY